MDAFIVLYFKIMSSIVVKTCKPTHHHYELATSDLTLQFSA
jgi:hypothetical protein